MNSPALSVLLTVFNGAGYLEQSIRSILDQTFGNFEFLIVDDASTDDSAALAEAWSRRDNRIRVIRNAVNKGQTACLNQGLRQARGEWTARQDADDLSHPLRFAKQMAFLQTHPELGLLGTNGWIIDDQNRKMGLLDAPCSRAEVAWSAPFLNPFMHTAVVFRTALVRDELGGYDETYRIAQDYELWTRLLAAQPGENLPDRLVSYRHLTSSLTKAGSGQAAAESARVSERELERAFGRKFGVEDRNLVAAFREGLSADRRGAFWRLYEQLRTEFSARKGGDLTSTVALHHLKAAGASGQSGKGAMAVEIARAFRENPGTTWAWFRDRFKK